MNPLHGPPATDQQPPDRCQSVTVAVWVVYPVPSTVTSCREFPVEESSPAKEGAQAVGVVLRWTVGVVAVRETVVVGRPIVDVLVVAIVAGIVVVAGTVLEVVAAVDDDLDGAAALALDRMELEHAERDREIDAAATKTKDDSRLGLAGVLVMSASTLSRLSPLRYALVAVVVLAVGACGSSGDRRASARNESAANVATTTSSTSTVPSTVPPTTKSTTTLPAVTNPPAFAYNVSAVTAADVPSTWRPGCPLPPSQLRMIHMSYWAFDSTSHTGAMVVNAGVVGDVLTIFRTLYQERFPIYEMVPQDVYGGNDNTAAAADDTSGFNCRYAVTNPPSTSWSVHAYGEAIDVNDVQNPYVNGSTIIPPAGASYLNRSDLRPGMAVPGGPLVRAFASVGWQWGGRWNPGTDYQHFSKTGG